MTSQEQSTDSETPMTRFMDAAIEEAREGLREGGIPVGAVLVLDGRIVGRGHNLRVQKNSPIFHAEMSAIESAGRLTPAEYHRAVLYTTLSPCDMCSGAILLYGIPTVVIGENRTFHGPEEYLRARGIDVIIMDDDECTGIMSDFIRDNRELWNEDVGQEWPH